MSSIHWLSTRPSMTTSILKRADDRFRTRLDQNQDAAGPPLAQRPAFLAVFPSIMLPMFLAVVDQTIVATALPAIAASTDNVVRASWVVVSYLIASTIAAPVYGGWEMRSAAAV